VLRNRLLAVLASISILAGISLLGSPAQGAGDNTFHVACDYSHSRFDDPIVKFNMADASHRHDFFGFKNTKFNTRPNQLVGDANTTCKDVKDVSAYWAPSVYVNGTEITPLLVRAYYENNGSLSIEPYAANLKVVAGNSAATGEQSVDIVAYTCTSAGSFVGSTPTPTPQDCSGVPGSDGMGLVVRFPQCWDGTAPIIPSQGSSGDVSDTAHLAYRDGNGNCVAPFTHQLPQLVLRIHTGVMNPYANGGSQAGCTADWTTCPVKLAGKDGNGNVELHAYYTLHADFMMGWEATRLQTLVTNCSNGVDTSFCGPDRGPGNP
jgi:hypothetical protein